MIELKQEVTSLLKQNDIDAFFGKMDYYGYPSTVELELPIRHNESDEPLEGDNLLDNVLVGTLIEKMIIGFNHYIEFTMMGRFYKVHFMKNENK